MSSSLRGGSVASDGPSSVGFIDPSARGNLEDRSRSIVSGAGAVRGADVEDERPRFEVGVCVGVAAGVLFAEPGRGGGCMGVGFEIEARDDPERASVGV
jgi:hypothetical protein